MNFKTNLFILTIILCFGQLCYSQIDNVTWSSVQFSHKADELTTISLKPIMRHNNDISSYQNSSIDLAINRKIGKGWYVQHIWRHWWIPEGKNWNFVWLDLGYGTKLESVKLAYSTFVRIHWANDTGISQLTDFLRFKQTIKPIINSKIVPFLSYEGWWLLNDITNFSRYRIETGFSWSISNDYALTLGYRRQADPDVDNKVNHFITNLKYSF